MSRLPSTNFVKAELSSPSQYAVRPTDLHNYSDGSRLPLFESEMRPRVLLAVIFVIQLPPSWQLPVNFLSNASSNVCFAPVMIKSRARHVHLICAANSTFCPDAAYLSPGTTWTSFDSSENFILDLNRQDFCLIASENIANMLKILCEFNKCQRGNVVLTLPPNATAGFEELRTLFSVAWKLGIVDIVVVLVDSLCRAFSYIPFREDGECFDTSPILIDSWNRDTMNSNRNESYFTQDKISNLHLCRLVVEYNVIEDNVFTNSYTLISFLNVAMNSTDVMRRTTHFQFPQIADEDSDIFLGSFYVTHERLHLFVIPPFLENFRSVIALPRRPISAVPWFRLLDELSNSVWCLILVSFPLTVCLLYVVLDGRKDFGYVVLLVLQSLLAIPCTARILPWPGRLYFSCWLMFCVVLNATYLSTLLSKLTVPFTDEAIKTVCDMAKSDLHFQFTAQFKEYAMLFLNSNPDYEPMKKTVTFVNTTYRAMVQHNRTDIVYICNINDFEFLFSKMSYRILDGEVFVGTATRLMLPRPSPYESIFSKAIMKIFEAGAFVRVEKFSRKKSSAQSYWNSDEALAPLSLKSLAALFVLWCLGALLALIAFGIETLIWCYYSSSASSLVIQKNSVF